MEGMIQYRKKIIVFKEEIKLFHIFLTKGGGFILGPIEKLLGGVLNYIYIFLTYFGIENVGLSIIFFTLLVKTIMIPLTIKQQKASKVSSAMNPEIMAIQNKYKGKNDEKSRQKMQMEIQAVYEKYGTNQLAGCLPNLITLPIMMGLYRVIYKIPAYIEPIKQVYEGIADKLKNIDGSAATLVSYGEKVGVKVSDFNEFKDGGILTIDHAIDILMKFKTEQWDLLAADFSNIGSQITEGATEILRINSIPGGLNLLESPVKGLGDLFPGILIPVFAVLLQLLQTKLMVLPNTGDKENPAAASMGAMNKIFPLMSGIFCLILPTGVGLYIVSNTGFTVLQQFFINKYMNKIEVEDLIKKNQMKKKKKPNSRANYANIEDQRTISDIASKSTKSINTYSNQSSQKREIEEKEVDNSKSSYSTGNISDYANILKNRSNEKEDK